MKYWTMIDRSIASRCCSNRCMREKRSGVPFTEEQRWSEPRHRGFHLGRRFQIYLRRIIPIPLIQDTVRLL